MSANYENIIERRVEAAKRNMAIKAFDEIYSCGHPVVVETHIEEWNDSFEMRKRFRLHYRLTAVQSRDVVIPLFEFVNHNGNIEWKCPACGMVNKHEATYCGELHKHAVGCGRPKDLK